MNSNHPFCSRENAIYSLTEGVDHEVANKINSVSTKILRRFASIVYTRFFLNILFSSPLFFITYLFIIYSKHWLKLMVSAGFKRGTEGAKKEIHDSPPFPLFFSFSRSNGRRVGSVGYRKLCNDVMAEADSTAHTFWHVYFSVYDSSMTRKREKGENLWSSPLEWAFLSGNDERPSTAILPRRCSALPLRTLVFRKLSTSPPSNWRDLLLISRRISMLLQHWHLKKFRTLLFRINDFVFHQLSIVDTIFDMRSSRYQRRKKNSS